MKRRISTVLVVFTLIVLLSVSTTWGTDALFLAAPAGGENIAKGISYQIRWDYSLSNPNMKIKLILKKGGQRILTITPPGGVSITQRSYSWVVPASLPPDNNYRMIIKTTDGQYRYRSGRFSIVDFRLLPKAVKKAFKPDFSTIGSLKPDLAVLDMHLESVSGNCKPVAVVRNLGPGAIPVIQSQTGESAYCFRWADGRVARCTGRRDDIFNEFRQSGISQFEIHSSGIVVIRRGETETITITLDPQNLLDEVNENNNTMTKTLTCNP